MYDFDFMFSVFPIIFFGMFAIVITIFITGFVRVFRAGRHTAHTAEQIISHAVEQMQQEEENRPKSLNGMDSILVPQIMADFPHFSERQMKDEAAEFTAQSLRDLGMDVRQVHNVVFASYDRLDPLRTITMQLAVEVGTEETKKQLRYELLCQNKSLLPPQQGIRTFNCPNCAAPLTNANVPCPYCGSAAKIPFEMQWKFSGLKAK